ncbi:hypothetical protein D1R32_gp057 [Tunisvirus fontaine2]|uniref:Uncharacterized protein n=1 Tax=Tunisvirus fontaine2 TaxID=1421067 RepID=V9SFW3_9VIRU|nr:hypothetical protein D1R32_gp057 [Tunisvirus fontaine2]AHC54774.1 hypothetical protein TNS_ORF56 [Tunisvirus fontaine2]
MSEQECKKITEDCKQRIRLSLLGNSMRRYGKTECLSAIKEQQKCFIKLLEEERKANGKQ